MVILHVPLKQKQNKFGVKVAVNMANASMIAFNHLDCYIRPIHNNKKNDKNTANSIILPAK